MSWLFGLLLIAHGVVHAAIWLAPVKDDAPFDVRHSRLFGDLGVLATCGGVLAGLGFVMAGSAYLGGVSWWAGVLLSASAVSITLLLLTFTTWWLLAGGIDLAVAAVALDRLLTTR